MYKLSEPKIEIVNEFESVELKTDIVCVSVRECVNVKVLVKVASLKIGTVNIFDCVNAFDSEN